MKKIYVSDFTLKKLSERTNEPLLFREKTAIAECIDNFGADAIELPAVKNEKEDTIIYKTIASAVKNCAVCIPVGFTDEGVEIAWNAVKEAKKPILQVSVPVSTVTMEYTYHIKEPKMIEKVQALVKKCSEFCDTIEFIAEDATRASETFLVNIINAAKNSGASSVTLCDDVGTALPGEITKLIKSVKNKCDIDVYVALNDNMNTAVASALSALFAGADGVKTAVLGDNVLKTDEFCKAVSLKGDSLGISTGLKATEIHTDIKRLAKKTNKKQTKEKSDGGIFLDGDSTLTEVTEAVKSLGYVLSDVDNENVYRALKNVCETQVSVGDKALEAIVASSAMQAPSAYHLDNFVCTLSNRSGSMANIVLTITGKTLTGVAVGDGPIDAAFRAIEQCIGFHYELDDFQVQAVTEGKEALGSTVVRLRNNGKIYSGIGLSTDIVGASIRAYINALNKIVFEGEQN